MKTKLLNIIVLALLFTSCGGKKNGPDASGVFEAAEVIVSAQANGQLVSFTLEEGTELEAGAVVGQIDKTQQELSKAQLEASIKTSESRKVDVAVQLAPLQQDIATQKKELERYQNLLKSDAATTKQVDDIRSQLVSLEKQLDAQRTTLTGNNAATQNEIASLEIQVAQIEDQINKSTITAPLSGTVLAKYAQEGEYVQSGKALFRIADLRRMTLRAYITSDQLTKLKLGQKVTVSADFGEKDMREYTGTLTWISDKAEFTPKTIPTRNERANLVYAIKIAVDNDGYLKKGMYGEVTFTGL
ncbi:HlyD family efflux transporter periplasmic adaptor subunit [Brucepastera parasyntrophica]|uniref:HlyD family secretion protein n=1 Tax=Brucepastera parasyntrophica TaxID=2880008 RepID=UPI00210B0B57|nr:HlyD family efflux transporter periplasmic adaptor subunit [Brucepastera parasyntrophica]ULQ58509.1 HlyD family efflux transporter periplasmic adaptor subunit [Brucepastera parasyntrophica]